MALVDYKIAAFDNLIAELPDEPNAVGGLTAAQLKDWWDSSPNEVRVALNNVIDLLVSTSGASAIGVLVQNGVSGANIQEALENILTGISGIVLGQITDGSLTDVKLSGAAGQIKDRVNVLTTSLAANTSKNLNEARLNSMGGMY